RQREVRWRRGAGVQGRFRRGGGAPGLAGGGVGDNRSVIARIASDEAIQPCFVILWIASRSLSSGGACADPLARYDGENNNRGELIVKKRNRKNVEHSFSRLRRPHPRDRRHRRNHRSSGGFEIGPRTPRLARTSAQARRTGQRR